MKIKTMAITTALTAMLGTDMFSTPTSAETWYSGVPAVLRGKWRTRTLSTPVVKDHSTASFARHTIVFNYFGSMPDKFSHLKWHRTHKYKYSFKVKRFMDGYKRTHRLIVKRTSRNTIYIHLDGHKYPGASVQELFHRVG